MKHYKLTENEIDEIKKDMQVSDRSSLEEREGDQLEHQAIIKDGEGKLNILSTKEGEAEIQKQREQISKLKEKIESTFYQVKQMEVDKRPRLWKPQNMFKIKLITRTANDAMGEIL